MSEFFLKIVNMSISASWLVLAVLLLRLVLKKAPKWVSVLLWGLVAVRLICPFSIESMLSLIPSAETVSPEIMLDPTPEIHTGIGPLNSVINPIITESFAPDPLVSMNPLQLWIPLAAIVWIVGIAAMLIYTALSYILLRRKVSTAVLLRDNIFQSENVGSPFVLGIVRPKIYLPFQMDAKRLEHVIAHEEAHIRRKDHWWKPFGFLLLAIHWFNPLMWLGYILLCRDIELACDEKVISKMDNGSKADYTQALLTCSVNRRSIAACPLAFGEVGVKERVKSVMNYKKPAFWIIIAAVVICIVVAVCFLTNPKDPASGALPNIHSHAYKVEEVTYEAGMYSFTVVAGENAPIYAITEDMTLASQMEVSAEGTWAQLGKLEQMELTKENFDDYFVTDGWIDGINAAKLRKNTEKAWQLIYDQEVFYYILQQSNGDLYLAYGYQAPAKDADPGSFHMHIRWLYKLAIDTTGAAGTVARSGENTVPMVSFPAGTVIADYVDSVYWLTVDPGEELVPFTTWRDGEEIRGFCTAYDAETFEPLKHFIPSGLDPQTYLFQNADPTRKYIVLATFSTEPNAQIYAFGARFEQNADNNADSGTVETFNGNMKTYCKNADGTWQADGRTYQHRLVITGRMHNAAVDSTFVYLSNLETITFDQAWKAAGLSSNTADYFPVEDAVLVEFNTGSSVIEPPQCKIPPDGTLCTPDGDVTLTPAGYAWTVQNSDGTATTTIADQASRPLPQDSLKPVTIDSKYAETVNAPASDAPTDSLGYLVEMNWKAAPGSVTYTCWPEAVWQKNDTPEETVVSQELAFYAKPGGYIYEIAATWDDTGAGYFGKANYYVYIVGDQDQKMQQTFVEWDGSEVRF